jgi:hypothetical protein
VVVGVASLTLLSLSLLRRCVVADKESEDIARYFEECWAFIDDAFRQGSSVLVHCAQGNTTRYTRHDTTHSTPLPVACLSLSLFLWCVIVVGRRRFCAVVQG